MQENYSMNREKISENIKRRLYADSMGRCMNPNCQEDLFMGEGDIVEKAHITPYCKTVDNSYENLIILCPNCHKAYDKNSVFSPAEVRDWKRIRKKELDEFFSVEYATFDELKRVVEPLLLENKIVYENYYLGNNKKLWNKFETKILVNNRKLKKLFTSNQNLIQRHTNRIYSNLEYIYQFIQHVDEFEATRSDEEKIRQILFPVEINSMFGITPMDDFMLPSTESLERLITKLNEQGKLEKVVIGVEVPYIQMKENGKSTTVFLEDTPRLRQLYFNYNCFGNTRVRLESLNFALKYISYKKIDFKFVVYNNLRKITIGNTTIIFVYEYCLSKIGLLQIAPEENNVIVNLHNWNGSCCISQQAYELSDKLNVKLLDMEKFYEYINGIKHKRKYL